ncbi:MAG TPA: TetR/AcrR family transcriptional regulator [Verrucomicrobiae bacterium]|nr:TetR/AcrR family transcriptional regulator [Verrucomicrobiae bacterium]
MSTFVPTPRDSEAKLQHILLHSAAIFAKQGFAGTSIRDISRDTGVSLSGLYYYFESKQKLLYLIQNTSFIFIVERLQKRLDGVYEPEMRLRILVQNHIEYFLSHPNEMKVLSHEEDALESPYREEVATIKRRYYALARTIFDSLKSDGLTSGVNPRVAVLSLFGMMNWIYKWHKPKVDPNAEELTNAIVGIFLHGVRKGGMEERALSTAMGPANTED